MINRPRLPMIAQIAISECGLACLAMIASYFRLPYDLGRLRSRFGTSMRGTNLEVLSKHATEIGLITRPLRVDLGALPQLKAPAILHWNLNHFVVLKAANRKHVHIHDPAKGILKLSYAEVSQNFTGVALEITQSVPFSDEGSRPSERLRLSTLLNGMKGLGVVAVQLFTVALAVQLFNLLPPLFIQFALDGVIASGDVDILAGLGIGFAVLIVISALSEVIRGALALDVGARMNVHMATQLYHKLLRLPHSFFYLRHVGDIVSRFESLRVIQRTLSTHFIEGAIEGLVALPLLVVMFLYSPLLSFITLASISCYLLVRLTLYLPLRHALQEQIGIDAKRHSNFLETVRGIQGIKLFRREAERENRWQIMLVEGANAGLRAGRLNIVYRASNSVIMGLEYVALVWIGVLAVVDGALSVGMLIAFLAWKRGFTDKVVRLIERIIEFRIMGLHVERVSDIVLSAEENFASGMSCPTPIRGDLRVEAVCFSYHDADKHTQADVGEIVIRNQSFQILQGEWVALTGPSGCGKSTMVKLMTGLLSPQSGTIEVDGQEIATVGLGHYRDAISAVMQDDRLFAGTIAENISFFALSQNQNLVEDCARAVGLHEEIIAMPMGYLTRLGDMGSSLSGGQQQRLLVARALYKKPTILFLDEATSHMDPRSESIVLDTISRMNITRVMVSHRRHAVERAHRVISLNSPTVANTSRIRATAI